MITWLSGRMRIKDKDSSIEVPGFRCSLCNHFEQDKKKICPSCGGEYPGKVSDKEN